MSDTQKVVQNKRYGVIGTVYAPGDGYVYRTMVAPIPVDGWEGGGLTSHVAVTAWGPWAHDRMGRTAVLERSGFLSYGYFCEVYGVSAIEAEMLTTTAMYRAVALALNREFEDAEVGDSDGIG